ncbi:DUF4369 domain-containing protein [Massilibacteroides sp.]|uniref:DUF4369 domain-containing protein n=1 Tax=Massilibacteroides sp. TaxID=2034766 RepID=UPI00262CEF0D|nr:DUF4369 domain-containing protein [Massilibacteroides sp.]MDD4514127.1 DUF4369 domain-containing protein [Massilibacteroides sp.]
MYKYVGILFCILLFSCQSEKKKFEINGEVIGKGYENEIIYLVPLKGATAETVDSTYIKNGRFHFSVSLDSSDIRIIRTRPILRLKLEELLVVTEAGTVQVVLDSVSRAKGTPLNNLLQEWKEKKTESDRKRNELSFTRSENKDSVALKKDLLKTERNFSEYNYSFVKENKNNIVGQFVFGITKGLFSPEELQDIEEL